MKIVLINNLYEPWARGGAENVVKSIRQELLSQGHEATVIASKPYFAKPKNKDKDIYYISGIYFNLAKWPKFIRLFWHGLDMFDVGSYMAVRSILKKAKPDMAFTHNLKGIGFLLPALFKQLKIKHIHALHDIQLIHPSGLLIRGEEKKIDSLFNKIYIWLNKKLFNSPYAVISPSNWLMDLHSRNGFFKNSKKIILPNPINPRHSEPATAGEESRGFKIDKPDNRHSERAIASEESRRKIIYEPNNYFKFLYAGQIEEHKGIIFLIKAFIKLSQSNKNWQCELIIAGDGSEFTKAKKTASGYNNIKLLGRVGEVDVFKLMQNSDCLIVPSLCYENSPTVIYEAFQAGLPVLASRLGGIPELIKNEKFLFNPGDEYDLIDKIKWVIENYCELEKEVKENEKIINNFKEEDYIKRLINTV
ncbi:hypothetical protein COZ73_03790 [Candidatus Falkowbacteria bacterium CG_4_8_14_3_um_filter_36_11]|nr:MAG: hypothetical protein COZ73_03790 [Candidatus Falkowbacteria bacterium CG_4_8_14_3_um_filter_36_11]